VIAKEYTADMKSNKRKRWVMMAEFTAESWALVMEFFRRNAHIKRGRFIGEAVVKAVREVDGDK
jgi:hypothetical protein